MNGLLTDIPFGASSDLRHPLEHLGHDFRILGQWQALCCAHLGRATKHDQMDDGGIRAGDRNSRAAKAGSHRPPHATTRPEQDSLLDTMVHGYYLLSLVDSHGHGINPAVLASQGTLGLFAPAELSGPKGVRRTSILGKQLVHSPITTSTLKFIC